MACHDAVGQALSRLERLSAQIAVSGVRQSSATASMESAASPMTAAAALLATVSAGSSAASAAAAAAEWANPDLQDFSAQVAGGAELDSGLGPKPADVSALAVCLLSPDKEVRARAEKVITQYSSCDDEPIPFFLEAVRRGEMRAAWHLRMLGGAVVLSRETTSFAWRAAFSSALLVCPPEYLRSCLCTYAEALTPEMLDAAAARPDITPPLRALARCFARERRLLRLMETTPDKECHDRVRGHYNALCRARELVDILRYRAKSSSSAETRAKPASSSTVVQRTSSSAKEHPAPSGVVYTRESIKKLVCNEGPLRVLELERLRSDPVGRPLLLEAIAEQVIRGNHYWRNYCPYDAESRAQLDQVFCKTGSGVFVAGFGLLLKHERLRDYREFSARAVDPDFYEVGAADGALEAHELFGAADGALEAHELFGDVSGE